VCVCVCVGVGGGGERGMNGLVPFKSSSVYVCVGTESRAWKGGFRAGVGNLWLSSHIWLFR